MKFTGIKQYFRRVRSFIGRPLILHQVKPVILDDQNLCDNPIFLIGVHRSGTSLTRRILDSHPNIACPPESFFMENYAEMINSSYVQSGYEGFGYNRSEFIQDIRVNASRLHEGYRIASNKGRWADKTPQYISILNELKLLYGDKGQFIMLYRHPFDVIHSIVSRGWRFENTIDDLFYSTVKYVSDSLDKQLLFERNNNESCYRIYYEKLVSAPEFELKKVFNFLNEPWSKEVLLFNKKSHNFGTEDPIVRGTSNIVPSHRNWLKLEEDKIKFLSESLKPQLKLLGYNTSKDGDLFND